MLIYTRQGWAWVEQQDTAIPKASGMLPTPKADRADAARQRVARLQVRVRQILKRYTSGQRLVKVVVLDIVLLQVVRVELGRLVGVLVLVLELFPHRNITLTSRSTQA